MKFLKASKYRPVIFSSILLILVIFTGTIGYYFLTHRQYSFFDCLYMTFITITTIGFGEIVKLNHAGRAFTIFIAFCGIGVIMYLISNITALLIEGEINEVFKKKKMEKKIKKLKNHYIVCGIKGVGFHISCELINTKRDVVVIDINNENLKSLLELYPDICYLIGDATDEKVLKLAGVERAKGIFAALNNDNLNLVISLTAKYLNPGIKVVAKCTDLNHVEKIRKAGADYVVSPDFIGGLRMVSEMVRPVVVSFLDVMLRDKEKNLRIEEITISEHFANKTIKDLKLEKFKSVLLLAIRHGDNWIYNPPKDYVLKSQDTLIIMTTPEDRIALEKILS